MKVKKSKIENFLSTSRVILGDTRLTISDGVDICYCLEHNEDLFKISIIERGKEIFKQISSCESLSIAYLMLLAKNSFSDTRYDFLKSVSEVEDLEDFLIIVEKAGLADNLTIDNFEANKIALVASSKIYFYDGDNKFLINYLPSLLYRKLYVELFSLRNRLKWLEEIETIFDLKIPEHVLASLLGYDDSFLKDLDYEVENDIE